MGRDARKEINGPYRGRQCWIDKIQLILYLIIAVLLGAVCALVWIYMTQDVEHVLEWLNAMVSIG